MKELPACCRRYFEEANIIPKWRLDSHAMTMTLAEMEQLEDKRPLRTCRVCSNTYYYNPATDRLHLAATHEELDWPTSQVVYVTGAPVAQF